MPQRSTLIITCIITVVTAQPLCGSEKPAKSTGWHGSAELAIAWLGGNSESRTTGLAAEIRRAWPESEVRLEFGGTLTDAALTTRTAVGTPESFEVREETREEKTAEYYFARSRYDYRFNSMLFTFAGVDWLNNRFAGIQNRFLLVLGGGKRWTDEKTLRIRTDAGFSYTFQDDVIKNPFVSSTFPGLRFTFDSWGQITASTQFTSLFIADWNVDELDDVRLNWTNSLPVAISGVLSLRPTLQLLWRNRPSLTDVALETADGTATGQKVLVPLQKLDTKFVVALVAEF